MKHTAASATQESSGTKGKNIRWSRADELVRSAKAKQEVEVQAHARAMCLFRLDVYVISTRPRLPQNFSGNARQSYPDRRSFSSGTPDALGVEDYLDVGSATGVAGPPKRQHGRGRV